MQRHCTELTERLLLSLDEEYNVVNMAVVVDVIKALEKTTITKEVLEVTRLGKYINELRRKTHNEALAKRAKDLVRRWREMVLPSVHSTPQPTVADTAPPALNGANPQNTALRNVKPQSPAFRGLKPQSPAMKSTSLSRVSSPCFSLHSDQSHSPVVSPNQLLTSATSNHKFDSNSTQPEIKFSNQNYASEAVPRTHSSNKRLRKDDSPVREIDITKKKRLNGEKFSNIDENVQVPSLTLKERNPELIEPSSNSESNVVKKRGRKKGSKSTKKQVSMEDSVKEKLASISRNPKLKTTQELLADLQARGSNSNANLVPSHNINQPNIEVILKSKNDGEIRNYLPSNYQNSIMSEEITDKNIHCHQQNILLEQNPRNSKCIELDTLDGDTLESDTSCGNFLRLSQDLTVEEILAKLPPLDSSSIEWNDSNEYCDANENKNISQEVAEKNLERLHTECVEGLNGNFQPKLAFSSDKNESIKSCMSKVKVDSVIGLHRPLNSHKDEIFREWHEMLARPSYEGQILHILPYVIID